MSFIGELKRRNVFRIAGLYAVVSWLLVQIAASLEEAVGLPVWFDGFVVSLLAIGFPIALVIAWAFEVTPEGIKPTSSIDANESITAQTGSKLDVVLVISLLIFAGAMLAPRFFDTDQLPGLITGSSAAQASIAVLPFADLSADGDQEYFADGVSEELLNVLAKVDGMKVAGRTSSFSFKGRNEDLREIGRILDVEHILEGSVRSQGNKIRVTAQLIQVSDGFHLWSETYDGDLSDIFAVQDEIANSILVAMKTQLNVEEALTVTPTQRTDTTAYSLFLEARDLFHSRNPINMQRALELLNQAIGIDPSYAPAYASRAKAFVLLSEDNSGTLPAKSANEQAELDVKQALALDPELAEAYAVRGLLYFTTGFAQESIPDLRRAVELNPNSLDARTWLAKALGASGRARDTADELRVLIEIDPLYAPAVGSTIALLEATGDKETARRIAERYIAGTPDENQKIIYRSKLLRLDGKLAESMKMLETLPEALFKSSYHFRVWQDYANLGMIEEYAGPSQAAPVLKPYVLAFKGDFEGTVKTARAAIENSPGPQTHNVYFELLADLGHDREIVDYFKRELNGSFESLNPKSYFYLASALRSMGEPDLFEEAMNRIRDSLDEMLAGGTTDALMDFVRASYWSLQGQTDKAFGLMEQGFAKAQPMPLPVSVFFDRSFESLSQEARFLNLREANLERVNREREILGHPPLTIEFYDRFESQCEESQYCDRSF